MLLGLLGGGLRLVCILRAETIARDGTVRLHMARELTRRPLREVVTDYDYHPGFSMLVGATAKLTGARWPDGWILAGQLVSAVAGLVIVAALWVIAAFVFDRRVAWVTAALAAVSGPLIEISGDALSDMPAVALALLAVATSTGAATALRRERPRAIWLTGLAGLLSGLGYLVRPEALLAAMVAAALLLSVRRLTRRGRLVQLASAGTLVAGVLVIALPYALAVGQLTQKQTLQHFIGCGAVSHGRWIMASARPWVETAWGRWLDGARRFFDRGRAGVGNILSLATVLWWCTYFGRHLLRIPLPRAVMVSPRRGGHVVMFAAAIVMLPLLTALEVRRGPDYLSSRHTLMPFLLMGVAAGAGVVVLARWTILAADKLGRRAARSRSVAALWAGGFVLGSLPLAFPVLHEGKGVHRQAGLAIAEHWRRTGPERPPRVLATGPWEPFYAGADVTQFRHRRRTRRMLRARDVRSPDALYAACRAGRYDYVAVDEAFLTAAKARKLPDRLRAHRRFDQCFGALSGGDPKQRVMVFAVRRPGEP